MCAIKIWDITLSCISKYMITVQEHSNPKTIIFHRNVYMLCLLTNIILEVFSVYIVKKDIITSKLIVYHIIRRPLSVETKCK